MGGGCVGLAVAWEAARAGLGVALVDPEPGSGASHVAAGMLAPVSESSYGEDALLRLNLASAQRYPAFVSRLEKAAGRPVGYRACGALNVALDSGDRAVLGDLAAYHRRLGLNAEPVSGRDARRLEPALAAGVAGALVVPDDHQVDPRQLTSALLEAAKGAGVALVAQRARRVLTAAGRAVGVELSGGDVLASGAVVVAAGCWSRSLVEAVEGVELPVRPVKGQILTLRRPVEAPLPDPLLARNVVARVEGRHLYLVPRSDGRVLVGSTVEERGFDTTVTAGAVHGLLHDARLVVPAVEEMDLAECTAGLRPGSPDNAPMIGPTAVPGLFAACGHYRNGVLLTPVTAEAVALALESGRLLDELAPFSPQRFAGRGAGAGR